MGVDSSLPPFRFLSPPSVVFWRVCRSSSPTRPNTSCCWSLSLFRTISLLPFSPEEVHSSPNIPAPWQAVLLTDSQTPAIHSRIKRHLRTLNPRVNTPLNPSAVMPTRATMPAAFRSMDRKVTTTLVNIPHSVS